MVKLRALILSPLRLLKKRQQNEARTGTAGKVYLSSKSSSKSSNYTKLPSPTWSISSLELDQKHEPISREELSVLAKRALISVSLLDSMNRTDELRQDLGNMIHMIQQVQDFATAETELLSDADIYDKPRGVKATPTRSEDCGSALEEEEAKQVWDSFLKPKTTAVGAHSYFAIATKKERNENKAE